MTAKLPKQPGAQQAVFELTRLPLVKTLLRSRWPQFGLRLVALLGFVLAILAGLLGTPVGSRNFAIIFVWIAWWALLMLIAVPLFGRGWCSICPIPLPGEWIQQGAILDPPGGTAGKWGRGLGRRWPKQLRSIWLQNGAFAMLALFSTVVLTNPQISAIVLAAFLFIAFGTSLIFERRAFCRYLCPVGGFIGLYAQCAPVELRIKDSTVCAAHTQKTCYTGNADGYGCPWQVYPGGLTKNTYCGTCMECLRTCPHDNIAINLRALGNDLLSPGGRKLDEVFKAFIMLGSAIVYSAVLLGPWGSLKSAAYGVGSLPWFAYAAAFLVFVFGVLPGAFLLVVAVGRAIAAAGLTVPVLVSGRAAPKRQMPENTLKSAFITLAYSLVPLGLTAWIAFSLSFVFTNLSYIWPSLSDPLGWGWNLFGTAHINWTPYLTQVVPVIQALVLLGGLVWSNRTARTLAGQLLDRKQLPEQARFRLALPVTVYSFLITAALMGLLIG